jgi:hypothetical protein
VRFRTIINETEARLLELTRIDGQIVDFISSNDLSPGSLVSFSVDAMAMTSDRHYLVGRENDCVFDPMGRETTRSVLADTQSVSHSRRHA